MMFEWPIPTRIDMATYPRKEIFEHFMDFELPIVVRTIQVDISRLNSYIKVNRFSFSLTFGFILTRAINHVPEFHHRVVNGELIHYNKIIPSFTVLSPEKSLYFSKGVFSDVFADDYPHNAEINARAARGLERNLGPDNQGHIYITNNPWNSFTSLQFPYSKRIGSIPVFGIGKFYQDGEKLMAPLAIQNHHGLTDGYHVGHFLDIFHRHLEDPNLIEQPFTSSFLK